MCEPCKRQRFAFCISQLHFVSLGCPLNDFKPPMNRLLPLLYNPFLLALWGTLLIAILLPLKTNKYLLRITDRGNYGSLLIKRYGDLDGDGTSELIATFHNSVGDAGLTVSNSGGVLDQWNFRGNYQFTQQTGIVLIGDQDNDKTKEIYVFTLSADSVLLHIIPDFRKPADIRRNILVSKVNIRKGKVDAFMIAGDMDDLTGDGYGELIFAVGTGYSLQPRRVFAYDAIRDSFLMSPVSGYFINQLIQTDLTGDKAKEIIPYGYAACNVYDTLLPYPDSISWMMMLDQNLSFVFPPVPFSGEYSEIRPFALRNISHEPVIGALFLPPKNRSAPSRIIHFNRKGEMQSEQIMEGNPSEVIAFRDVKGRFRLVMNRPTASLDLCDESLHLLKRMPFRAGTLLTLMDADLDGQDEIVATDNQKGTLHIIRNNLKHPVAQSFEGGGQQDIVFSIVEKKGFPPSLYLQSGNRFTLLQYAYNKTWPLRFGKYGLLYAGLLLFTLVVRKIQQIQIRQKTEAERKITDLQLRIVRNQLDPHFTMNAVNSVIAGISAGQSEEAKTQLLLFSSMHRSLLLDSDRTRRSLEEELRFTENYLALEKFRFRDRFEYQIDLDKAANIEIEVPKMMLQVYVENALKHGILPLRKQGLLNIRISGENPLTVEIRDNGVGRQVSASFSKVHTGKGMMAMQQTFELFARLGYGRMQAAVNDLFDAAGIPAGTSVTITIHPSHEKRNTSPPP